MHTIANLSISTWWTTRRMGRGQARRRPSSFFMPRLSSRCCLQHLHGLLHPFGIHGDGPLREGQ